MHVTARVPPFVERCPEALVPPEVEAIVMRLMKKEATERFDDAKELIEALVNVMALLIERGRIEPRLGAVGLLGPHPLDELAEPEAADVGPERARIAGDDLACGLEAPLVGVDARAATVDARVNSESGAIRLPQPAARGNRLAAIAATVLAILSLIVVIFVVMGRSPKRGVNVGPDGGSARGRHGLRGAGAGGERGRRQDQRRPSRASTRGTTAPASPP